MGFYIEMYRQQFKPSEYLDKPYVMAGYNIIAANTNEEAELNATSLMQSFVNLRRGTPGKMQAPIAGYFESLSAMEQGMLRQVLTCSAIGSANTIWQKVGDFIAKTQVDELIISSNAFDHEARMHSFKIIADVLQSL